MQIAITGGTGFVGRHLAPALLSAGHSVVLIARELVREQGPMGDPARVHHCALDISDVERLAQAIAGCDAVAHCAGISHESRLQTFQRVHVVGTRNVVAASERAGVSKVLLLSFLRARAGCGSPYHESKWASEEIVRLSGLDYTILKAGVIYGSGDRMLANLSQSLRTFPVFPLVGIRDRVVRPVAVEDVVRIIQASLTEGRLSRQTVAVVGPEEISFRELVRRVARVVDRRPLVFGLPVSFHTLLGWVLERTMTVPLVSRSQVRMLAEGIAEPLPVCDALPDDLRPQHPLSEGQIRRGLPRIDLIDPRL
jgi:uncharacterized protein YbjT (DUF2867 family)